MKDFSLNILQFGSTQQDINKISIDECMVKMVTVVDLHCLL